MDLFTADQLWEMFKHLRRWLGNLQRARQARKEESINALRKVILAARQTSIYTRQLQAGMKQDFNRETELATLWTELSFLLADLGLTKLAKRCDIKGRYWADPEQFDIGFLEKSDSSLARMEQLANQIINELDA